MAIERVVGKVEAASGIAKMVSLVVETFVAWDPRSVEM